MNLTVGGAIDLGTARGILASSAAGIITASEGADGEVLISSSAGAPAWNPITAGAGITVTNGPNSISIECTGIIPMGINEQVGVAYQFILTDAGKLVTFENAAPVTVTIAADAGAPGFTFAVGTQIILMQRGAGKVTVAGAAGVTIMSPGGRLSFYEQYSNAAIIKLAGNVWWMCGDLS